MGTPVLSAHMSLAYRPILISAIRRIDHAHNDRPATGSRGSSSGFLLGG